MALPPYLAEWLTVLVVGWLAVMSPGPDLAMTLRNSLGFSRRAGLFTAVGIAAGLCVHTLYSLVGIGVVIAQSVVLFSIIKWAGAAYLVYVGVRALRAGGTTLPGAGGAAAAAGDLAPWRAARAGFLTNVLNPKVTLFFLALFTQVIDAHTPGAVQALYGLTIVGISTAWFSAVAVLVSQRAVRARLAAVSHWVERVTGLAFIGLGLRLAASRAAG